MSSHEATKSKIGTTAFGIFSATVTLVVIILAVVIGTKRDATGLLVCTVVGPTSPSTTAPPPAPTPAPPTLVPEVVPSTPSLSPPPSPITQPGTPSEVSPSSDVETPTVTEVAPTATALSPPSPTPTPTPTIETGM